MGETVTLTGSRRKGNSVIIGHSWFRSRNICNGLCKCLLVISGIPFDTSQIGQYIHVRAKSYSGALSDEKIIYLPSNDQYGLFCWVKHQIILYM